MIPVRVLVWMLDQFHDATLGLRDAARLGIALARMDCVDLLTYASWPPIAGLEPTALVFMNVRGLYVGPDDFGNLYKIETLDGTWWHPTYSAITARESMMHRQTTLERAQLRCEQHRRLTRAASLATTAGASGG